MHASPAAEFGQLLRARRLAARLTQAQLAEAARLSVDAIRKLESGTRRAPYHETASALAEALRMSDAERDHFITIARRARSHGPPAPAAKDESAEAPSPKRFSARAIGVGFGTAVVLAVVLAVAFFVSAPFLAAGRSHRIDPATARSLGLRITSFAQCATNWSAHVVNNTEGSISIVSGTGAFSNLSPGHKELRVLPGETLDGKVLLYARNAGPQTVVAPLIYTPTWGPHENNWRLVTDWVPDGTTLYSPMLHVTIPTIRASYYLLFAFALQKTPADVASATDSSVHRDVWGNGNEIAEIGPQQINEAQRFGCTLVNWLTPQGYQLVSTPADAVTLEAR